MARGKKKETLTPEERLQAALIPEREQPYKVPENWCWVKFGTVCKFENGYAFKSERFTKNQGIPVVRISNIVDNSIALDDCVYTTEIDIDSKYIIHNGDLLIAMSGATTGKNGIYDSDKIAYLNQRVGNIKVIDQTVLDPFFRNFYISSAEQQILNSAYGGAQPNISSSKICDMSFPLPPLPEQQRIVDRIESLFAKLDEARQKAQDALDSFETRKAAILHRAFTGELTSQWRKEHGVGMESWENSTVGQVCHDVKVGIVIKPSQYYTDEEKGTPAFRSANVRENRIDDFDWVYLNHTGMENNSRSIVHTGDVLVVRSGNPGTACVVSEKFDGYNAIDILIAVPDHRKISSEFLCAYTNSPFGKKLIFENKRGMALAHFNVKGYSGLPIRVPQLNEQAKIICILDDLLAKEQQAKEAAEGVLEQIDLIKKAILARAFRGELGTNDPSEESAVELVKRVLAVEPPPEARAKAVSIPREVEKQLKCELERKIMKLYYYSDSRSLPINTLMEVSSKKFEVLESIRNLEQRGIIKKLPNGNYKLVR